MGFLDSSHRVEAKELKDTEDSLSVKVLQEQVTPA